MKGTSGHLQPTQVGNPRDLPAGSDRPERPNARLRRGRGPQLPDAATRLNVGRSGGSTPDRLGPDRSPASAAHAFYEAAGPALLAGIDPDEEDDLSEAPDWWPVLFGHLQGRLTQFRNWRYSWWIHAREKARLILPYRYHWVITPNLMNRGNPVNQDIIDATGTLAMRVCASGMYSGLMGPSRPWFKLAMAIGNETDPPAAVQRWLDDATMRILAVFAGSNFYRLGAQMMEDVSTFGTSPMLIYEDAETIIHCYLPCFGEFMLGVGGKFRHDAFYREYVATTAQIVDFFGFENCPPEVRNMWREGGASLEFERVVAHAIEPNFQLSRRSGRDRGPVSVLPGHFLYREVYWLRNEPDSRPLSLRGFMEWPLMVMGWTFTSNEAYARGPSDDALGAINQLQHEQMRKGEYIDHFVRPPMTAPPELRNQPSSTRPGDITYTTMDAAFKPAFQANPAGMAPIVEDIKEVQGRVRAIFHNDAFLAISEMEGIQPRERLELTFRMSEKIQLLGPVIETAEAALGHAVYRVASIMQRRGMFAPMPPELQGQPVKITYISQMKQLQNAAETSGIQGLAQFAGEMTEGALAAGLPPPVRVLDLDRAVRRYGQAIGAPAILVFSEQEVAKHDAIRAKAQQAQQMAAATAPAVQAAQGLASIPPGGGNSVLGQVLGGAKAA